MILVDGVGMQYFGRVVVGVVASVLIAGCAFSYANYGPVKRGDNLWRIAMKHRPSKRTNVFEMIQAIRHLNPTAFRGAKGDILKTGVDLKIPVTVDEIRSAAFPNNAKPIKTTKKPVESTKTVSTPVAVVAKKPTEVKPEIEYIHQNQASAHQAVAAETQSTSTNKTQASTQLSGSQPMYGNTTKQTVSAEAATTDTAVPAAQKATEGHSFWSWVWFVVILGLLFYIFRNRTRLFASFQGGNDAAARRLGLNRNEPSVQAYKTETLWADKKPSYAKKHEGSAGAGEGEAMAQAMIEMAEGRYSDAKETLLEAVSLDSHNLEFRMKLLDVFVALNDSDAYKRESDYLLEHMISEADPRWNRIRSTFLRKWAYDQG